MFDSTNPRHTELLTKVLDSFAEAIDQARINVMEKLEASFSTPEVAGTGDELSMINLELSYAAKVALEVPKTYAAARLAGDPDFTVRGAWGKGQIQKFFDRPGVAHTSFTVYTVPGDEHGSAGITMVEVVPPKVDLTNAAELLAALDTTSKDYATAFLVLASDELGVTWVQNTHPNRLDLLSENLSEGRRAVGIVGIEKKQPLGTGVRFHRILLDPAADNWTKTYLTTGCQGLEDSLKNWLRQQ